VPLSPLFKKVPIGSRLIRFGNCFYGRNESWYIALYFLLPDNSIQQIPLAVEALPYLALNRTYLENGIDEIKGWNSSFTLPSVDEWKLKTMKDVPINLLPYKFSKWECDTQYVYKINSEEGKIIWIPVIELARFFLLRYATHIRHIFYEGNLNSMAIVKHKPYNSPIILLSKLYPKHLMNNAYHNDYLSWLLFNQDVQNSLLSIFKHKNNQGNTNRWRFVFTPFDMDGVILHWCGRWNNQLNEGFVNEVTQSKNVQNNINYENIQIFHPNDIEQRQLKTDKVGKPMGVKKELSNIVDDDEEPTPLSTHRLLKNPSGILSFNKRVDIKRIKTEKEIQTSELIDEDEQKEKISSEIKNLGITESGSIGKGIKAEFANFENDETKVDPFESIRSVVKHIQRKHPNIHIQENVVDVPFYKNIGFSYLNNRRRKCYYAMIQMDRDRVFYLIEPELSDGHILSTLLIQLNKKSDEIIKQILKRLVKKYGHWDKKMIIKSSISVVYLKHVSVENFSLKTEKNIHK